VYGANPTLPKHEGMVAMPMSPYAVSKLAAESYVVAFANVYGLPALPLRFFNVYGPRQRAGHVYAAVVPVFLDAAMRGQPLPRHGDGEQSRDFTYVGTVCDVLVQAVKGRVGSGPTNLAFGTRVSLNDLIAMMEQQLGRSLEVAELPTRAGDVRHSEAANDRLRELFPGLQPVPLETGLATTIDWMRTQMEGTR
jgi:UDP-glucose 4-epimerase